MDEKFQREIKEFEDAGIDVVATNKAGEIIHNSVKNDNQDDVCNGCEFLRLVDDPDPFDWFRDDDKKALCELLKAVICGSLEPRELVKIYKPVFCPKFKLEREITKQEQEAIDRWLKNAKKRYKALKDL